MGKKGSQQERGGKGLREEREKIWGKMPLGGKGGEDLWEEKGNLSFSGGKGPRGQWGEMISNGKGEDLGANALGGKGEK